MSCDLFSFLVTKCGLFTSWQKSNIFSPFILLKLLFLMLRMEQFCKFGAFYVGCWLIACADLEAIWFAFLMSFFIYQLVVIKVFLCTQVQLLCLCVCVCVCVCVRARERERDFIGSCWWKIGVYHGISSN
jgi:hypothetical protein